MQGDQPSASGFLGNAAQGKSMRWMIQANVSFQFENYVALDDSKPLIGTGPIRTNEL